MMHDAMMRPFQLLWLCSLHLHTLQGFMLASVHAAAANTLSQGSF